ncbi:putative ATP binding protein [Pseudoloma neurophilia]|uniref:GPN-loop GTPase 2 n=1 Tax=Pseudoloma neurophilia TaxID=146866 RepID=A0A0R0M282_9MICR|nr:putative ATP binding protein [Pseudoloma neurophilia]
MVFGEIVIGMPGSGKTTYIAKKRELLKERNIFTVNLDPGGVEDPGNSKSIEYDFDIRKFYTTRKTMESCSYGPNFAVKYILQEFCAEYSNFSNIFSDEGAYYLIDTPGQIESIIILEKFLNRLQKDNIRLVTVFLVELASFISYDTLAYTYLISLQTMIALNNSQVNVITKCDLIDKIETIVPIEEIASLNLITREIPGFFKILYEFVERESVLFFQFLEYEKSVLASLQYVIDQASGLFYEIADEEKLTEYLKDVESREEILEKYASRSEKLRLKNK